MKLFSGAVMCPRRKGDYVDKPFIEMTGKEMLEELLGHLAAVDPARDNIADHTEDYGQHCKRHSSLHAVCSALFNRRVWGPSSCCAKEL